MLCSLIFSSFLCLTSPSYTEVCVRVTCYEPTGYRTASMKTPKNGMVATSNRRIPFGTKAEIDGKMYVVEDRTAKWVGEKFKYQTFDIFSEEGCGKFGGTKNKLVKIYK